ncbi:MAG: hypothetical protein H6739_02735 [Alphaproteobacteria bacterium]|nr:hypothetical protein [Alphaproteobacteria bacterium]
MRPRTLTWAVGALLWAFGCSYHLGRAPASGGSWIPGEVRVASAEPSLESALRQALAEQLQLRAGAAEPTEPLHLDLIAFTARPVAQGGDMQEVRMTLRLSDARGHAVDVAGAEPYGRYPDPLRTEQARAAAVSALAGRLVASGVAQLAHLEPDDVPR